MRRFPTMRPLSIVPFLAAAAVLTGAARPATPAPAGMAPKLPTIEGRPSLATVGKDSISVDAFMEQLGLMHQGVVDEPAVKVRHQDPFDLLERLINIKLVLQ